MIFRFPSRVYLTPVRPARRKIRARRAGQFDGQLSGGDPISHYRYLPMAAGVPWQGALTEPS